MFPYLITEEGCYLEHLFNVTADCSTTELRRNALTVLVSHSILQKNQQNTIGGGILHVYMPRRKETRTYRDRADYLKKAVADRRRKLRLQAIEYGGGSCQKCGYKKSLRALSFHHKNPAEKDFGLSARGLTRSWEKIKIELDKCILVCANCHMELHDEIEQRKLNMGTSDPAGRPTELE